MTTPDPDADLDAALEELIGTTGRETRAEYVVRVDLPPDVEIDHPWIDGPTIDYAVDSASVAVLLAASLVRDWHLLGVKAQASALAQTWVLAAETEITGPLPRDNHR